MDSKEHPPETSERRPSGIAADVRQPRTHGAASAAELREFFAQTRGRSSREVLGMVAESQLTRSIALAAVGTALVLAVGTFVPWLLSSSTVAGKSPNRDANVLPTDTPKANKANATDNISEPAVSTRPVVDPKPGPTDAMKAVKAMGLGDTKTADPKSNPLENKLDNLLDNVK